MKMPTVACAHCDGTGRVPLVPSLAMTLIRLRAMGPTRPGALARSLGTGSTAMNNRLEKLRALGLVTRERHPQRGWIYAPCKGDR